MPTLTDLVSQTQLAAALSGLGLSAAQLARLPELAAAASRAIRKHCNRDFTLADYDELYTVPPGRSSVTLRQFPVAAVDRVAANPSAVLTVAQTDPTNYRASVALACTGDADAGLTPVGLTLARVASGAAVAVSVPFSTAPTVGALASAVDALGSGWSAEVLAGFEGAPSADFRGPQSAPATGPNGPAALVMHADDLAYRLNERAGILELSPAGSGSGSDPADSPRFGPAAGDSFDDVEPFGGSGGVRVRYTAGFAEVPADVAQLAAEAVKASLERFALDSSLKSESDGVLSWTGRDELFPLSAGVRSGLAPWVNHRA